jgi:hypothetical protein
MRHLRVFSILPVLAAGALAACAVKEAPNTASTDSTGAIAGTTAAPVPTPAASANMVHIVAKDYSYDSPDQIPAGLTTLHLMNQGKEVHQAQLIKLTGGKTYNDYIAAMKAMKPDAPPPPWAVPLGGPNAAPPGGTAAATSTLEPGNYALVCFIPAADGIPHVMKGMSRGLVVTAATGAVAAEPVPTTDLTLSDYKFTFSSPLKNGENIIRVDNAADQPHEVVVFKLLAGKTMKDFEAWLPVSDKTPPPAAAMGGIVGQVKGQHAFFTANLDPGDYVLICFLPDAKDGKPHFMHGMIQALKIT